MKLTKAQVKALRKAASIREELAKAYAKPIDFSSPESAVEYMAELYLGENREHFDLFLLDNRHALIERVRLFSGTLDGSAVYPREVVKSALDHNAAAVIFSHNHPSGVAEPSQADRRITERLRQALSLVDVRVLDHIVVGRMENVSFAQRGWI